MTLPGMRERRVQIGSAGKTFSLTGWKVGYVTGAPALLEPVAKAHQFLTFTTPPNLQRAVAYGLGQGRRLFTRPRARSARQARPARGRAARTLGFDVLPSAGTYFITADFGAARLRRRTTSRSAAT